MPKWLIPAGLMTLVIGGLAYLRKPAPKVGDVVGVPLGRLADPSGKAAAPIATVPSNAKVALLLIPSEGAQLRGNAVGFIDPTSNELRRLNLPIGLGPFGFAVTDVTDIFRGPVGQEKRI